MRHFRKCLRDGRMHLSWGHLSDSKHLSLSDSVNAAAPLTSVMPNIKLLDSNVEKEAW